MDDIPSLWCDNENENCNLPLIEDDSFVMESGLDLRSIGVEKVYSVHDEEENEEMVQRFVPIEDDRIPLYIDPEHICNHESPIPESQKTKQHKRPRFDVSGNPALDALFEKRKGCDEHKKSQSEPHNRKNKLNWSKILFIRELKALVRTDDERINIQKRLAKYYKVNMRTIYGAWNDQTWVNKNNIIYDLATNKVLKKQSNGIYEVDENLDVDELKQNLQRIGVYERTRVKWFT